MARFFSCTIKITGMRTVVGVYENHHEAVEAVRELKSAGFNTKQISLIGKVKDTAGLEDVAEDDSQRMKVATTELGVTAIAGSTIGLLTGIGVFAIPGLGFLFGAGALVGAIAGFDLGLIGGGIISALTLPGVKGDTAKQYEKEVSEGKLLLVVQGTEQEVHEAQAVLASHGKHDTLETHHSSGVAQSE
jgi:uncharacterized membrane protein